jgi:hypothetical protein
MPNVKSSYLKVIKVPLGYKQEFKPIAFKDKMPILYLELLENKTKVKPELRNKDYVPPANYQYNSQVNQNEPQPISNPVSHVSQPVYNSKEKELPHISTYSPKKNDSPKNSKSPKKQIKILDLKNNKVEIISKQNKLKSLIDKKNTESKDDSFDCIIEDETNVKDDTYKKDYTDDHKREYIDDHKDEYIDDHKDEYKQEETKEDFKEKEKDSKLSGFFDILKGVSNQFSDKQPQTGTNTSHQIPQQFSLHVPQNISQNVPQQNHQHISQNVPQHISQNVPQQVPQQVHPHVPQQNSQPQSQSNYSNLPPSLSEITSGKVNYNNNGSYRELNPNASDENEYNKKKDLLFKFRLLKKSYKEINIPDFNEYTDLATLEREYNHIVKNLRIDSNVENYKKYLMIGFFGLEYILSTILKFEEIKGFTQQQILNMNQYERILVEIGEKSYVPEDKQIMPELRLLGIVFINAATFVGTKMLFKGTGSSILNAVMNMPSTSSTTSTPPPKKKMRGPDIDLDFDKKNE